MQSWESEAIDHGIRKTEGSSGQYYNYTQMGKSLYPVVSAQAEFVVLGDFAHKVQLLYIDAYLGKTENLRP